MAETNSTMTHISGVNMTVIQELIQAALAVEHPYGLNTRDYRAGLVARLAAAGWTCRTRFKVDSRGTCDGYKGVLDLVAHPPFAAGQNRLDDPVLVEIDRATIRRKTLTKLAAFPYRAAGRVIILTDTDAHFPVPGVDAIICLA